ncbi:MAG: hypothetical protein QXF61_02375 [Nitrososphaeria archaeon]
MLNNVALLAALRSTDKNGNRESPKLRTTKRIDRVPNKMHVNIEMIHKKGQRYSKRIERVLESFQKIRSTSPGLMILYINDHEKRRVNAKIIR